MCLFQVYEEKEKMWERELRKIKGLYDNRLRASQQKSSKMEQALTNQTYQVGRGKCPYEKSSSLFCFLFLFLRQNLGKVKVCHASSFFLLLST